MAAMNRSKNEPAPSRSWLSRVLRNSIAQEWRSETRRSDREHLAHAPRVEPASDEVAVRLETQRKVFECVSRLEPKYRDLVVFRYFDSLPPREIATRLERPIKTIHTQLRRALELLREQLEREFPNEDGGWLRALMPYANSPVAEAPALPRTGPGTKWIALGLSALLLLLAGVNGWFPFAEPELSHPELEAPAMTPEESESRPKAELESVPELEERESKEPRVPLAGPGEDRTPVGAVIRGIVFDETDRPVGALLWAVPATSADREAHTESSLFTEAMSDRVAHRTHSNRDGEFEFGALPEGEWWVGLAPSAEFSSLAKLVDVGGSQKTLALRAHRNSRLVLEMDSEGARVIGKRVKYGGIATIRRNDTLGVLEVNLGVPTSFEIAVPPGVYELDYRSPDGTYSMSSTVTVEDGPRRVQLDSPSRNGFFGVVVHGETGEPTKAQVTLASDSGSYSSSTSGNPVGSFAIEDQPAGLYTLLATTKTGLVAWMPNIQFAEKESRKDIRLELVRGATIALNLTGVRDRCRLRITSNGQLINDFTLRESRPYDLVVPPGPVHVEAYLYEGSQRIFLHEASLFADAGTTQLHTVRTEF